MAVLEKPGLAALERPRMPGSVVLYLVCVWIVPVAGMLGFGGLTVVSAQQRVSVTRDVEAAVARVSLLNEIVQSTTSEAEVDIASELTSHGLGDVAAGEALSSASPAAVATARAQTDDLLGQLAASPASAVLAVQLRGRLQAARALDPTPPAGSVRDVLTWTGKRSTALIGAVSPAASAEVQTGLDVGEGRYGPLSPALAHAVIELNAATVLVAAGGQVASLFAAFVATPQSAAATASFRQTLEQYEAGAANLGPQLTGSLGALWTSIEDGDEARMVITNAEALLDGTLKPVATSSRLGQIVKVQSLGLTTTAFQTQLDRLLETAITQAESTAKHDRGEALARARLALGASGGLLALTVLLWLFIGGAIRVRLQRLAQTAEDLSLGVLRRVDPRGPRELSKVGQGLNDATASIERVLAGAEHLAAGDLEAALELPSEGRLSAAVGAAVQLVADSIRERESLQRQLAHQATHDQLTGLPNRGAAERLLQDRLDAARSGTADSAVLFIDLDHFKAVNDTHGHAAGDHVLRIAAARMRAGVPEGATVCRLGGDEFVVVLPGGAEPAREVGELIVTALAEPINWQGTWLTVGGSVGVGVIDRRSESVDAVLTTADRAVYLVKARGRGGVEIGLTPFSR